MILKFAGYGFNKSHSTAYAAIAWQTAYLKAHYPVEFMAALLTGDIPGRNFTSKDSLVEHHGRLRRMNVEVVAPVRQSFRRRISPSPTARSTLPCRPSRAVVFRPPKPLSRNEKKTDRFEDLFDFCERIESSKCNRSSIETLIKAGAMDCFGAKRAQLTAAVDRALQAGCGNSGGQKKWSEKPVWWDDEEPDARSPRLHIRSSPNGKTGSRCWQPKKRCWGFT